MQYNIAIMKQRSNLPQICQGCGQPIHNWVLHHIVPVNKGGFDIPSNLALLCRRCHGLTHLGREMPESHNESLVLSRESPQSVIEAIAAKYSMTLDRLVGPSRRAEVVRARDELIWRLHNHLGLNVTEIGRWLNGRDHSTIIHSLQKTSRLMINTGLKW